MLKQKLITNLMDGMPARRENRAGSNVFALLQDQLKVKQLEINSLLEVTKAINDNLPSSALFRIYEFILRAQMRVESLAVFIDNDEEDWALVSHYGIKEDTLRINVKDQLSQYEEIVELGIDKPAHLAEFDLIIPVFHKNRGLAYALVGRPGLESYEALKDKIKFIQTITNIIMVAIENKRLFKKQLEQEGFKKELEVAAQVQSMLIPYKLPNDKLVEMAAIYLPHRNVGGDYYDYIRLSEDEFVFCIADISGKGIAAALLMANFQAHLQALIQQHASNLIEFVEHLNKNVKHITRGEKFITLFLGKFNAKTRLLEYVNAGHNPPVLYQNSQANYLDKGCTILGMFDELPFIHVGELKVDREAIIVNYTDGLTDLENEYGNTFSVELLEEFIQTNLDEDMEEFNRNLLEKIISFKGKKLFVDDISVLSCRFF